MLLSNEKWSDLVKRRFSKSLENLSKISMLVDNVRVFDNDIESKLIYAREGNTVYINNLKNFDYLPDNLPFN